MSEVPGRILLVEDDRAFARSLERRLASEGYTVSSAEDGREGMRAIVTFEPHLVLSDWIMPHVDGLELCQAVKTGLGDEAPFFIVLTSNDEPNAREQALASGADDYLVKPCATGELLARIRGGLRLVALQSELKRVSAELEALRAGVDGAPRELSRVADPMAYCRPCGKVCISDGVWEDLAHLVEDMGLMSFEDGTCPDCRGQAARPHPDRESRAA